MCFWSKNVFFINHVLKFKCTVVEKRLNWKGLKCLGYTVCTGETNNAYRTLTIKLKGRVSAWMT